MNCSLKHWFAIPAVVVTAAAMLCADEIRDIKQGDIAFARGDYHNAVSFYSSALKLQEQKKSNPEAWAENILKLAQAHLFDGNVAEAEKMLKKFRAAKPAHSAGTLPGDILGCKGKYAEAEKFFLALEKSPYPKYALAAQFRRGAVLVQQGKYAAARNIFLALEKNPAAAGELWFPAVRREYIYSLIKSGNHVQAFAELEKVADKSGDAFKILYYLAKIAAGDLNSFKSGWTKLLQHQYRRNQPLIFELLNNAIALAARRGDTAFVAKVAVVAADFTGNPGNKKALLHKSINIYSDINAAKALETARIYRKNFPAAPENNAIDINVAKALSAHDLHAAALQLLNEVINGKNNAAADRMAAAELAVIVAEKLNDTGAAINFYEFMLANTDRKNVSQLTALYLNYAEFLYRMTYYAEAVKQLNRALPVVKPGKESRNMHFLLLESLLKLNNDDQATAACAADLIKTGDPVCRAAGEYALAVIAEKNLDTAAARKHYLLAAKEKSAAKYAQPAQFAAALIAFRNNEFATAAGEFREFARNASASVQAPEAVYLAYQAYQELNDKKNMQECMKLLRTDYPDAYATAVLTLQSASDRVVHSRDYHGAISELEELEKNFAGNASILSESMLMRSRFLYMLQSYDDALRVAVEVLKKYPASRVAAECALNAGTILFERGAREKALEYYRTALKLSPVQEVKEVIQLRIADCELSLYAKNPARLAETVKLCRQLAAGATDPDIQINARYKLGKALEFSGDFAAAAAAYEQLLFEAREMHINGSSAPPKWCVRALEDALKIFVNHKLKNGFKRGIMVIESAENLGLERFGANLDTIRRDFHKVFKKIVE